MNVADSEVVGGILAREGYAFTRELGDADVVLVNTCAVRDNAEQRIHGRLGLFHRYKREKPGLVVGVLGCMAERLRTRLVDEENLVDLVVGPDEYRRLPGLIEQALNGEPGIAVRLSRDENYEDIPPLRAEGISAWVSVMRGCDKFCTFCVVPFTRGRERSRSLETVVREVGDLVNEGFREVTLLGQNVNSYLDNGHDFADLMRSVAAVDRGLRVRFMTPHPQDMSDRLIEAIAETPNLCKHIHLPVQSGSDRILRLMARTYSVDHYRTLVGKIRQAIPGVSLTTDIISGFPTETLDDHRMTLDLVKEIRYDSAFTFKYSARERTKAWEMGETVSEEEKGRRVLEVIQVQHAIASMLNRELVGKRERVLVEGPSRKSASELAGRTGTNKMVIFPSAGGAGADDPGREVDVVIRRVNAATLFGERVQDSDIERPRTAAMQESIS